MHVNERNEQNQNDVLEEARGAVTPPPFRQSEEPQDETQEQQPSTSPTLADRIAAMGLDEETTGQLQLLTQGLDTENVTTDLLDTLARGVTHDTDVQNADATGYLRGRNEKIEAVLHPEPEEADETESTPVFPRYSRRSIWD